MVPRAFVRVLMIQSTIQATSVLLPMPCPLETAIRIGWTAVTPSNCRCRTAAPSRVRNSACHTSGPVAWARNVFGSPHGYIVRTNLSGSP